MSDSHRIDFASLRANAIDLSQRQVELRRLIQDYLSATGITPSALATRVGARERSLAKFLRVEQALINTGLQGLGEILGAKELCQEIVELGENIPDRYLGLVNFDEQVITIVCDLLVTFTSQPVECTMAEFAAAFPKREKVVCGALLCAKGELVTLRDHPEITRELKRLLDDKLEKRLKEAKESLASARLVKVEEVERLTRILLPHFDDKQSLVQKLGLARGCLDRAKLIGASEAQLDVFIAKLAQAIRAVDTVPASKKPAVKLSSTEVPVQAEPVDPFRGLAGTERDGVPYVLTEENFKEIRGLPIKALLEGFKESSRILRGYLALLAQLKGEGIRAGVQHPLVRGEIEELYLALELVSTTHPTALLPLLEKQRQQWGAARGSNSNKGMR